MYFTPDEIEKLKQMRNWLSMESVRTIDSSKAHLIESYVRLTDSLLIKINPDKPSLATPLIKE